MLKKQLFPSLFSLLFPPSEKEKLHMISSATQCHRSHREMKHGSCTCSDKDLSTTSCLQKKKVKCSNSNMTSCQLRQWNQKIVNYASDISIVTHYVTSSNRKYTRLFLTTWNDSSKTTYLTAMACHLLGFDRKTYLPALVYPYIHFHQSCLVNTLHSFVPHPSCQLIVYYDIVRTMQILAEPEI